MNGTFILLYLTSVSRWLCLILFPRFSIQHAVIYDRICCLGCLFVIQSVCYGINKMAMMTEAGRLTSVSDFKVIWCFVHVCVGVNKTFYKMFAFFFIT